MGLDRDRITFESDHVWVWIADPNWISFVNSHVNKRIKQVSLRRLIRFNVTFKKQLASNFAASTFSGRVHYNWIWPMQFQQRPRSSPIVAWQVGPVSWKIPSNGSIFHSLLTRPYFKGNSGLLNIESNRVQSLIFTRAVFQVLRKMYAHNYLTIQNIILKTNSQMGSKGDRVINSMIGATGQRLTFFARQNKA